jgi:hypothetical protein
LSDQPAADGVDVTPAQVHPHPHRVSIPTPLPLDAERDAPSFEKSNVLVMYVYFNYCSFQHSDLTFFSGPTGSGERI